MDNLRGFLSISHMDRVPNEQIRELCRVMKGTNERIEGVLRWFSHVERMENDRIAESLCRRVCWWVGCRRDPLIL